MPSSEFARICREHYALSETITIETSKEHVKFSVVGEIGSGETLIKANENTEKEDDRVILDIDEPVNLSFALRYLLKFDHTRYLNMFNKASSISESVVLYLSSESPLAVEFKIKNLGTLKFFLAPKVIIFY